MTTSDIDQDNMSYPSDMDDFKDSNAFNTRMTRTRSQKLNDSNLNQRIKINQSEATHKRKNPPVSKKDNSQAHQNKKMREVATPITGSKRSITMKRRRIKITNEGSSEEEDEDKVKGDKSESSNVDWSYEQSVVQETTCGRSTRPKKIKNYMESPVLSESDEPQPKKKNTRRPQQQKKATQINKKKRSNKNKRVAALESPSSPPSPTPLDNTYTPFKYPLKILPSQLIFQDDALLGEGRTARVITAKYGQVLVACKTRRTNQPRIQFEQRLARELEFASILSVCRSMNRYVGVLTCKRSQLVYRTKRISHAKDEIEHFAIQRYFEHGDLLEYVDKKQGGRLHPIEVLQIAIHLFSALTDAHNLDVGLVDVKRENVLIDNAGSAVLTDFGSCVRMNYEVKIDLDTTEDGVCWTDEVAAPEMIGEHEFYLVSDVFMATTIVAELMLSPMSSQTFQKNVLQRQRKTGLVNFQHSAIPPVYRAFCPLLKRGFDNDPTKRLTAAIGLKFLEEMYEASFNMKLKEIDMQRSPVDEKVETPTTMVDTDEHAPIDTIVTHTSNDDSSNQQKLIQNKEDDEPYKIFGSKSQSSLSSKLTEELFSSSDDGFDDRYLDCNELAIPDPIINDQGQIPTTTTYYDVPQRNPMKRSKDTVHENNDNENGQDTSNHDEGENEENSENDCKTEAYVTPGSSSYEDDPEDDEVQFVTSSRRQFRSEDLFESKAMNTRSPIAKKYYSARKSKVLLNRRSPFNK